MKFQKRNIDVVYSAEELAKPRESPFGTTNGDLKRALEFGSAEYEEIDAYRKAVKMLWVASCWDEESVDFIRQSAVSPLRVVASAMELVDRKETKVPIPRDSIGRLLELKGMDRSPLGSRSSKC